MQDETFLPHDEPEAVLGNTNNSGPGKAGVFLTVRTCGKWNYRSKIDAMIEAIESIEEFTGTV